MRTGRRIDIDSSWRDDARCRSADVTLFFPGNVAQEDIQAAQAQAARVNKAKALCQLCRVKDACLEFALVTNQEDGIWGGTTESERRRVRRAWLAERRRQRELTEQAS